MQVASRCSWVCNARWERKGLHRFPPPKLTVCATLLDCAGSCTNMEELHGKHNAMCTLDDPRQKTLTPSPSMGRSHALYISMHIQQYLPYLNPAAPVASHDPNAAQPVLASGPDRRSDSRVRATCKRKHSCPILHKRRVAHICRRSLWRLGVPHPWCSVSHQM